MNEYNAFDIKKININNKSIKKKKRYKQFCYTSFVILFIGITNFVSYYIGHNLHCSQTNENHTNYIDYL